MGDPLSIVLYDYSMSGHVAVVALLILCSSATVWGAGLDDGPGLRSPQDSEVVVTPAGASAPSPIDTVWGDLKDVATDVVDLFSRPARWGNVEWGGAAMGAFLVGTCTTFDETVRDNVARSSSEKRVALAEIGNVLGQIVPGALLGVSTYAVGLACDLPYVRRAGRHLLQSAVYASAVTLTIKSAIGRHRPFLNNGQYEFAPFTFRDDFNAFPSGHSTLVFAIASSLSADIDYLPATVVLYGLAGVTAWSRIYDDRHWASDVLMGGIIGTVVGHTVAVADDRDDHDGPNSGGLHIVPTLNGIGVVAMW